MGGFLKSNGKSIKTFEKPGIIDAGVMSSKELFNVGQSTKGLSTVPGTALMDIGSKEGRKLTKKARKKATKRL